MDGHHFVLHKSCFRQVEKEAEAKSMQVTEITNLDVPHSHVANTYHLLYIRLPLAFCVQLLDYVLSLGLDNTVLFKIDNSPLRYRVVGCDELS